MSLPTPSLTSAPLHAEGKLLPTYVCLERTSELGIARLGNILDPHVIGSFPSLNLLNCYELELVANWGKLSL